METLITPLTQSRIHLYTFVPYLSFSLDSPSNLCSSRPFSAHLFPPPSHHHRRSHKLTRLPHSLATAMELDYEATVRAFNSWCKRGAHHPSLWLPMNRRGAASHRCCPISKLVIHVILLEIHITPRRFVRRKSFACEMTPALNQALHPPSPFIVVLLIPASSFFMQTYYSYFYIYLTCTNFILLYFYVGASPLFLCLPSFCHSFKTLSVLPFHLRISITPHGCSRESYCLSGTQHVGLHVALFPLPLKTQRL